MNVDSKDNFKRKIENEIQMIFFSFINTIFDDSLNSDKNMIFNDLIQYVIKFFENFDIHLLQVNEEQNKNRNKDVKLLKKKRGRRQKSKENSEKSKFPNVTKGKSDSDAVMSHDKEKIEKNEDDLEIILNSDNTKKEKKVRKISTRKEKKRNKITNGEISDSDICVNQEDNNSKTKNCKSTLMNKTQAPDDQNKFPESKEKKERKIKEKNIKRKKADYQKINKENSENIGRSSRRDTKTNSQRLSDMPIDIHKKSKKERNLESSTLNSRESRSSSPYIDLSSSSPRISQKYSSSPSNLQNYPNEKKNSDKKKKENKSTLVGPAKSKSLNKMKDSTQVPKKDKNSRLNQTTPVKKKLNNQGSNSKSPKNSKKSPSGNLRFAEEASNTYNQESKMILRQESHSNTSFKFDTPKKQISGENLNSKSPKTNRQKMLNKSPKANSNLSNLTFKIKSSSSQKSNENNKTEKSANISEKKLSEKSFKQTKAISPTKFEITPKKFNSRSIEYSASKSPSFENIAINDLENMDKNNKTPNKTSNEKKKGKIYLKLDLTVSSLKKLSAKISAGSNKSKKAEKLLGRKRISFKYSNEDVAEFDPKTPVKEMKSKTNIYSNQKSSLTPTKSILNKKNLFFNESSTKEKSGKKKKTEAVTRMNTRANQKIGKIRRK